MEALASAGLLSPPSQQRLMIDQLQMHSKSVYPTLENSDTINTIAQKEKEEDPQPISPTGYPSLVQLQELVEEQKHLSLEECPIISPPSIEPLENFIEKRGKTIEGLVVLKEKMAKHVLNCKISNTVGNSASIIGGILCFVFPPVGVPVLLAGTATSLGTSITENVIERKLRTQYGEMLKEDSLAMKLCESNLKDITSWLITVYQLGYTVSRAGINFLRVADAIQAATTMKTWAELVSQLPSLANAIQVGAKTAGTVSGAILGISLIISAADIIQTWIQKNATIKGIEKDILLLEQQLQELKRIADAYHS
ncbi:unnamed protein product [Didymodactylos carnosus]|uniref:Uncharacterized protein n=1 Tax=Didymodactylos carnosus TaxID=1234261 RepID=A0A814DF46_9BILA|nr:unnamed protein product [Didymodactylos carnosus]CAF1439701.1 unnamed protein product [Didymodactylos carnosus]CAF3730204.1 unnamed protein product [Didymodactylos carnosus]CAF4236109.1 unnamed protein product [Didymodactylos carnosus]